METPLTPNRSQQMAALEPDSAEVPSYEKGGFLPTVTKCLLIGLFDCCCFFLYHCRAFTLQY